MIKTYSRSVKYSLCKDVNPIYIRVEVSDFRYRERAGIFFRKNSMSTAITVG
jgi:hypothetical protein